MRKNIPTNQFGAETVSIDRFAFESLPPLAEWAQPERHDRHSFFLLEEGSVTMEIDFTVYEIRSPALIYMHPDQVHTIIGFEKLKGSAWALNQEDMNPDYPQALERITPAAPKHLEPSLFALFSEAVILALKFPDYPDVLKNHINTLVGLTISVLDTAPAELSRFELQTHSFRVLLEQQYKSAKRPADYAVQLHITVSYLNECVKNVTGNSASSLIQQRVILEAKRLLYHSALSVKEVAADLGYDDYAYFSRLFTKVAGVSPIAFKNRD